MKLNRCLFATRRLLIGLLCGCALAGSSHGAAASDLGAAMGSIVAELAVLLDLSQADGAAAAARKARQEQALSVLQEQSRLLAAHIDGTDRALMASNLAYKLQSLRWHFARGTREQYRRGLDEVLEACGGCHRRTAAAGGSQFAAEFLTDKHLGGLDAVGRARILIASRQFEGARESLDAAIARTTAWGELEPLLRIRMDVGIRLVPDLPALESTMTRVSGLSTLTGSARARVDSWMRGLQQLRMHSFETGKVTSVDALAALIETAEGHDADGAFPLMLAASRMSYALVTQPGLSAAAVSRAYYLAARAEAALTSAQYLPMEELFLELAIRTAPEGVIARRALERLETSLKAQFEGETLPDEIESHLADLKALVASGQG